MFVLVLSSGGFAPIRLADVGCVTTRLLLRRGSRRASLWRVLLWTAVSALRAWAACVLLRTPASRWPALRSLPAAVLTTIAVITATVALMIIPSIVVIAVSTAVIVAIAAATIDHNTRLHHGHGRVVVTAGGVSARIRLLVNRRGSGRSVASVCIGGRAVGINRAACHQKGGSNQQARDSKFHISDNQESELRYLTNL